MAEAQTQSEPKVQVRILKAMAHHKVGEIIELPESEAKSVCRVTQVQHGNDVVDQRRAVLVSEESQFQEEVDIAKMTQKDMNDRGLKNVVASPYDTHPAHKALENTEKLEGKHKAKGQAEPKANLDTGAKPGDTGGVMLDQSQPALDDGKGKGKKK